MSVVKLLRIATPFEVDAIVAVLRTLPGDTTWRIPEYNPRAVTAGSIASHVTARQALDVPAIRQALCDALVSGTAEAS